MKKALLIAIVTLILSACSEKGPSAKMSDLQVRQMELVETTEEWLDKTEKRADVLDGITPAETSKLMAEFQSLTDVTFDSLDDEYDSIRDEMRALEIERTTEQKTKRKMIRDRKKMIRARIKALF